MKSYARHLAAGVLLATLTLAACGAPQTAQTDPTQQAQQATIAALSAQLATAQAKPPAPPPAQPQPTQAAQPTEAVQPTSAPTVVAPTLVPTETPMPTVVASPTAVCEAGCILYEATWNDADKWPSGANWKVLNGMLVSTGNGGDNVILAPAPVDNIADYAVEATIQVIRGGNFGLVVRWQDAAGYYLGVAPGGCRSDASVAILDVNKGVGIPNCFVGAIGTKPFSLNDDKEHSYRVEAKGNVIRFLVDDSLVLEQKDNQYLDPGKVGLWTDNVQLEVHSFKVIKL